nr:uncharacterized protein CI109_003359 [Kwoniella shandongensis]KAA5528071.1 hypothetical protein CI109_003359 [Kwoniella shandongensis]
MSTLNLLLALLALANIAFAAQRVDNTFIGCVTSAAVPTTNTLSRPGITSDAACRRQPMTTQSSRWYYSYYSAGTCLCTTSGPNSAYVQSASGSDAGADHTCSEADYYTVANVRTTFQWDGCFDSSVTSGLSDDGIWSNTQTCFAHAASYKYLVILPRTGANGWHCYFGNKVTFPARSVCTGSSYYAYDHSAAAQASALTKRQARDSARLPSQSFCPSGLEACLVNGSGDGYECIDTMSELESCGGCLNGALGVQNATAGTDCTQIAGVAFGGATCTAGRCNAFACDTGFVLIGGVCVSA